MKNVRSWSKSILLGLFGAAIGIALGTSLFIFLSWMIYLFVVLYSFAQPPVSFCAILPPMGACAIS